MGLLVNATADKKITIQGTEIEIPNVYVRLEFAGRADGKTLEVIFQHTQAKMHLKTVQVYYLLTCQLGVFQLKYCKKNLKELKHRTNMLS